MLQSIEQTGLQTMILMYVDGNYNRLMCITIPTKSLESRVLENDWITVRGIANGIYTYESAGSGVMSVPWVNADQIIR